MGAQEVINEAGERAQETLLNHIEARRRWHSNSARYSTSDLRRDRPHAS